MRIGSSKLFLISAVMMACNAGDNPVAPKIIGGDEANHEDYPFFVSLFRGKKWWFCGGSLVAPNLVLTAGHCVVHNKKKFYPKRVLLSNTHMENLGRNKLCNEGKNYTNSECIKVKQVYLHRDYNDWTTENDIAIIELVDDVQDPQYKPIAIDTSFDYESSDSPLKVLGYGATEH